MLSTGPIGRWGKAAACAVVAGLVTACGAPTVQKERGVSVRDPRLDALEWRVRRLERQLPTVTTHPAAPLQTPPGEAAASSKRLESLYERRRILLEKYTPHHPDVIILNREIQELEAGLPKYEPPLQELPLPPAAP